ncbi:MAG TPA: hypothetical protein PKC24_08405 [Cyclobacteriaceae bacterium]|nr:hypothetical protein [Cyclobacteriaceae bacterium]
MKKTLILLGIGIAIGSIAGYIYWYYLGCEGTCAITSSPRNSTIYGAVMGGLVANIFNNGSRKSDEK